MPPKQHGARALKLISTIRLANQWGPLPRSIFRERNALLVFPNGLAGGMVEKLNLSAPCPQGSTFGCHAVMVLPCGAWSDDQGQFLTSLICLPSYHRSDDSGNRPLQAASIVLETTPLAERRARGTSSAADRHGERSETGSCPSASMSSTGRGREGDRPSRTPGTAT